MAPPTTARLPPNEGDILLAISSIDHSQIQSVRRAASTFNVPESTLRSRRTGVSLRRNCQPKLKKLTKLEEEVIVRHILDLDLQGFAPSLNAIREIANKLLTKRGASKVGKN
jgi:hypothetical protein